MLVVTSCGICVAPEVAPGQNAPQRVEKVHYECKIDIKSGDLG